MFLDSATDRMKEIIIYGGLAFYLTDKAAFQGDNPAVPATLIALALGGSVLVSYVNAWGEAVMSGRQKTSGHKVNSSLRSGLMSFEVLMFLIIIGLVFGLLTPVILLIAMLSWLTALQRMANVMRRLNA
jgi:CDP-diacylglycerol---glycerol-3-phosphate 3-phosphatidyltransferase